MPDRARYSFQAHLHTTQPSLSVLYKVNGSAGTVCERCATQKRAPKCKTAWDFQENPSSGEYTNRSLIDCDFAAISASSIGVKSTRRQERARPCERTWNAWISQTCSILFPRFPHQVKKNISREALIIFLDTGGDTLGGGHLLLKGNEAGVDKIHKYSWSLID